MPLLPPHPGKTVSLQQLCQMGGSVSFKNHPAAAQGSAWPTVNLPVCVCVCRGGQKEPWALCPVPAFPKREAGLQAESQEPPSSLQQMGPGGVVPRPCCWWLAWGRGERARLCPSRAPAESRRKPAYLSYFLCTIWTYFPGPKKALQCKLRLRSRGPVGSRESVIGALKGYEKEKKPTEEWMIFYT